MLTAVTTAVAGVQTTSTGGRQTSRSSSAACLLLDGPAWPCQCNKLTTELALAGTVAKQQTTSGQLAAAVFILAPAFQ